MMNWFALLIGCGFLIAVLVIIDTYLLQSTDINTNIGFNNYVIIKDKEQIKKNEATDYARYLLLASLLNNEDDSISQYMPVHLYSNGVDITDKLEYHSLIEVKSIAIAIRLLLVNNTTDPEPISVNRLVVKSQEGKDLFILDQELQLEPYQQLYLVWYIQIAGENITEAGITQLLTALAYGNTQYKHAMLKDIAFLDDKGNILPFYHLAFEIDNDSNNTIHINAILKNNTAKDLLIKTIAIRNTALDYIFAYDLEEALLARAYSKISVKMKIQS